MNKIINVFAILMAVIFMVSTTPVMAASSDKKETTNKSSSSKNTKSKNSKTKSLSDKKDSKKSDTKKKSTSKKSSSKKKTTDKKKTASTFKGTVNINTATKEQLMQLPGIGDVKAREIIKTRKKSGKFKSADDLMKVNGIGDQTLKGIKKHVKF